MKQYDRRDARALDAAGGHYSRHVEAMTVEGLHAKADIAAELAWRDAEIVRLRAAEMERDALRDGLRLARAKLSEAISARKDLEGARILDTGLRTEVERLRAELADLRDEIEARDADLVLKMRLP